MRKPSNRVWLELKKELGRSSNLVWAAALLIWLALSTFRYSHWHSLSYHLLHNTWLSGTQNTYSSSHLSNPLNLWVPLHQLNGTHTDRDEMREYTGPQDGINVHTVYYHDDDDADYTHRSNKKDGSATSFTHEALHPLTDEKSNERQVDEPRVVETMKEKFERTSFQGSSEVQNEQAREGPSKSCATVEEMGLVAVSPFADSSLLVRNMIKNYFSHHGASRVRGLDAKEFCQRGFVFGRAAEDGLGNDIYKILTAAGLSIMLNRSLIVAEHGSCTPTIWRLPEILQSNLFFK